uniref:Uncharacterized protein n=2 Tax=Micrurus lemniscatus lemniscatus TaxID=129467 RepID=A0A2D4HP49_MICLE
MSLPTLLFCFQQSFSMLPNDLGCPLRSFFSKVASQAEAQGETLEAPPSFLLAFAHFQEDKKAEAVQWLNQPPKTRHLVPSSLPTILAYLPRAQGIINITRGVSIVIFQIISLEMFYTS